MRPSHGFAAVALAACIAAGSVVPETARAAASDTVKLKIGEIGEPIALIGGIDKGFFADQKLDIELVPLSGGPALISATISGSTDMNYGDVFAWAAAVANGFKVVMIQPSNGGEAPTAPPGGAYTLLVKSSGAIKTAADLVGKQIGTAPTQLMQLEVKLWLKSHGVDPGSVKLVPVTPYLSMAAALQGGHVDAIMDADPYTQQAQKQYGFSALGSPSREVVPNDTAVAGYYATRAWLKDHDDVARRFVIAYRKAATWANAASAEEKAAVTAKYSPLNLVKLQEEVPGIVQSFHYSYAKDGPIDVEATQRWVDLAVANGVLDKTISIKEHLYPTAVAKVVE